jgi:hypothetical protein
MTPPVSSKWSGERAVVWVLLVVALALAVLATRRPVKRARAPSRQDPLALVPPGPRLLLSADVAELTRLAGPDLLRAGGDKLLGLKKRCGFEPLLLLEQAVFAMPVAEDGGQASDFALIARTRLDLEQGLRCAELVIKERGGSPARSKLGSFVSVRDLGRPLGEVAMRADGTFVLSGGRYFRDVMDVAQGRAAADQAQLLREQLHRRIRERLGPAQLELTLLADAALPLPGIDGLGLAVRVGRELLLEGLVYCSSAVACAQAREVIEGTKAELASDPQLSGLASLRITAQEGRLELRARLPREQLGPLLLQLVAP